MTRRTRTGAIVLVGLAVAAVSGADKERCEVRIGDEYRLIDRAATKGDCEAGAREFAAPRVCLPGAKQFEFTYLHGGTVLKGEGSCSRAAEAAAMRGKARCKVKDGDDWRYRPRIFTQGGCKLEAKKSIGPKLCEAGGKRFHYTYVFDDRTHEGEGLCPREE